MNVSHTYISYPPPYLGIKDTGYEFEMDQFYIWFLIIMNQTIPKNWLFPLFRIPSKTLNFLHFVSLHFITNLHIFLTPGPHFIKILLHIFRAWKLLLNLNRCRWMTTLRKSAKTNRIMFIGAAYRAWLSKLKIRYLSHFLL